MNLPVHIKQLIENDQFDLAEEMLVSFAEGGNIDAQHLLGYLFFTNAEVNAEESGQWLWRAAQQEHSEAFYELSNWPMNIHLAVVPDHASRTAFLVKAAKFGSSRAQRDLGVSYALGDEERRIPNDPGKARVWLKQAVAQDNIEAKNDLAILLLNGECGPEDAAGAARLYKEILLTDHWQKHLFRLKQLPRRRHPDWFYEKWIEE